MADAVTVLTENIIWVILGVLGAIVIIVVVFQWRKVRETQNNLKLVEKQVELKKISLVEKDLDTKNMMKNVSPLPKEQQESLIELRENTSDILKKVGYLHGEIGEKVALMEAKAEYGKLQRLIKDVEERERDIDRKVEDKLK